MATRDDADPLHVAYVVEHEGEVIPERRPEADAQPLDALAQEELAPRRIELVGVKEPPGGRTELRLRAVDGIVTALELAGMLVGIAIVRIDEEACHHELKAIGDGQGMQVVEHGGLSPVIRVKEHHIRATGTVERTVARRGGTGILLMEHGHTDVALGDGVEHLARAVGGAIVHDQQLEVLERLMLDALDGATHVPIHVVGRHDDCDLGMFGAHLTSPNPYVPYQTPICLNYHMKPCVRCVRPMVMREPPIKSQNGGRHRHGAWSL